MLIFGFDLVYCCQFRILSMCHNCRQLQGQFTAWCNLNLYKTVLYLQPGLPFPLDDRLVQCLFSQLAIPVKSSSTLFPIYEKKISGIRKSFIWSFVLLICWWFMVVCGCLWSSAGALWSFLVVCGRCLF